MSLKTFHIVFITSAILLSIGFGTWCIPMSTSLHNPGYFFFAILSSIVASGLIIYEVWFVRKLKRINS